MMKHNSLSRLGGMCSLIVGVLYLVAGITYIMVPAEQKAGVEADVFLSSFAQNPTTVTLQYLSMALIGVLALAVVLAVSARVRSINEGWVRWTANIALIGFAVEAIQYFRYLALYPQNATAYAAGDATAKVAIAASQTTIPLDPNGWFVYGGVGLWFLVVNILALREITWPKPLAYVGVVGAIAYWFVTAGLVLEIEIFVTIAAAAAVILGPIWYIWMGLTLRQSNA